ncbi:MAG: DUF192 domain-containing protein [bacterium]
MNFKSYLENILNDEEINKWQRLYIPLNAEEVLEELSITPEVEKRILEKASIEDKDILQSRFKRNKYEFKTKDMITELLETKVRRVILIGESGSGKTTLLKWITLVYGQQAIEEINTTGDILKSKIPVYIDLATYHKKIEIDGFLLQYLKSHNLECSFEELIPGFESGKFLFLFDGLDLLGVKTEDFDPITSIQKFINKYPKNIYLLSCRKGVRYTNFPPTYKIIELAELTREKIAEYLAHYVKDTSKKDEILAQIQKLPQFEETTPLMLLLIIPVFTRFKEIPINKTRIYSQYINCLYDLFEKIGRLTNIEKELINAILSELGFDLQVDDETVLEEEKVLDIIANFIIKHKYNRLAKDEILKLCSQLGFLKMQDGEVKFFYQSFREYFASLKLKELFLGGVDISGTFTHPKWEDVLTFLSSNLEEPDASRLIQAIVKTPYEFRNPLFVAGKCLIGNMVKEDTRQEIINQLLTNTVDKYWHNQRESIYLLTQILGEEIASTTIESLIEQLKDEDWIRREKSAKSMGRMCGKEAIAHIRRLLEDENPSVYNAAFEALIEIERREKEDIKIELEEIKGIKEVEEIPPQLSEITEIIPQEEERKIIPTENLTLVYINLTRAVEGLGIQLDEAKSVIINQVFNNTLRPIIETEHGEVDEMEEEVTIATFDGPKEALYATVKMQSAIDEYNLRQPSRKVSLKLAVSTKHHGESIDRVKILATKIGELTRAGQILVIENAYKAVHGKDKTVRFRYYGSRKLEGEESQKRGIYELLWQGEEHASMIKESIMAIEYLEQVSAYNITKNKPIIGKIKVARTFLKRLKGLMFAKETQPLVIEFAASSGIKSPIHTFFVQFPIDAVFLDPNFKVVDLMENLPPVKLADTSTWKIYTPDAPAKYVLELPQGTIKNNGIELSDIIIFKEGI